MLIFVGIPQIIIKATLSQNILLLLQHFISTFSFLFVCPTEEYRNTVYEVLGTIVNAFDKSAMCSRTSNTGSELFAEIRLNARRPIIILRDDRRI